MINMGILNMNMKIRKMIKMEIEMNNWFW